MTYRFEQTNPIIFAIPPSVSLRQKYKTKPNIRVFNRKTNIAGKTNPKLSEAKFVSGGQSQIRNSNYENTKRTQIMAFSTQKQGLLKKQSQICPAVILNAVKNLTVLNKAKLNPATMKKRNEPNSFIKYVQSVKSVVSYLTTIHKSIIENGLYRFYTNMKLHIV
jgi:hypothetical protein